MNSDFALYLDILAALFTIIYIVKLIIFGEGGITESTANERTPYREVIKRCEVQTLKI